MNTLNCFLTIISQKKVRQKTRDIKENYISLFPLSFPLSLFADPKPKISVTLKL